MQNKSIQKRKRYVPPESGPPKAATVIIIRSDGNFLSLLPHSAKNPKWEEPGGRMDAGETALQCAVRETREETGIDLTDASFRLIGWVYSKWPKANVYVFKTDTMPEVKVDNIEIARFQWTRGQPQPCSFRLTQSLMLSDSLMRKARDE
jgi:8-oxo-dGTP pyrophosphatase MutT (NUDIX family)